MKSQVAIVTGSGRGIGAATAKLLAERGCRVVITSRTDAELSEVQASIAADRCLKVVGDISDPQFITKLFDATLQKWGRLDVLVNNAAIAMTGAVTEVTLDDWNRIFKVNVTSVFLASQEAFRVFKRQGGGGCIVNVSSLAGIPTTEKFAGFTPYSASKFAVTGLTETFAAEGRELKIRVNAVAPGAIDTRMLRENAPFLRTEAQPEDVARTIAYLCDPAESGRMTGAVLPLYTNQ